MNENTIIELNVMRLRIEEKDSRQTVEANGDFFRLNK